MAPGHPADDLQGFQWGSTIGRWTWPLHFDLSVHSAFPVDCKVKSCFRRIRAYDDFFKYSSEDHLLNFRGTLIAFPYRGKVLAHRSNAGFFLTGYGISHCIQLGELVFRPRDLFQLLIPATFQLARYQAISRIDGVVLFEGLPGFVLQLFELTGYSDALRCIADAHLLERTQTGI